MKLDPRALAVFALLLSACSFAPRKPFEPAPARPDAATVYFYRPSEMTARLLKPAISANGAEVGKLANDSYGVAFLPPGEVQVRSVWPGLPGTPREDAATLRVEAGRSYYVRVRRRTGRPKHLAPGGALQFEDRPGLEEVSEAEAVPQLAGLALVDLGAKR
jgi:hypothetical protein